MSHSTHPSVTAPAGRRAAGRLGLLALSAGVIAAAAIAPAAAQASARPAASASGTGASGTEHFQAMSTSATANTRVIIGSGLFTAAGVDHESSDGMTETLVFPGGSFKLKVVSATGSQQLNAKSCLFTITRHVGYKLVGGTGKYAGISGHGTGVAHILGVAARSGGKCSQNKAPVAFEQTITASGPARL
jgi:hypothetical protein